jgi:predicted dehydrogenase
MRVAIIGLGMAVKPHALALADLAPGVEIAAAYSPTAARREAFAAQTGFPVVDRLDAVVADPSIAAALVLTPPATHLELVHTLAAAGKHVLLEKPLEITLERSEAVVQAAREAGITLGVVFQHRFRPGSERLARRLRDGALGPVAAASCSVRWWRPQSYYDQPGRGTYARDGGGVLITQAIHTLDLFLSLAGPVSEVTAFAATTPVHRMEAEDIACAALRFVNGAIGSLDATTAAYPGFPERIEIVGSRGTALIVGDALEIHTVDGGVERVAGTEGTGGGADPMAFSHAAHRALIQDFVEAVEQGRAPRISGADALNVHRLFTAVLRSAQSGRPVKVPVAAA